MSSLLRIVKAFVLINLLLDGISRLIATILLLLSLVILHMAQTRSSRETELHPTNAYFEMVMNPELHEIVPDSVLKDPEVRSDSSSMQACFECRD